MKAGKITKGWILTMILSFLLVGMGCSGGGGGGGVTGEGETLTEGINSTGGQAAVLSTENVIDLHNETSDNYDDNCIMCHGSMRNGKALDGRPDAHAAMMVWAGAKSGNDKCTWCHSKIRLEFRNPSNNTHADAYADYLDPSLPADPDDQLNTVRLDTNYYEAGTIRKQLNPYLCLQCHSLGTEFEFYAE